MFVVTADQRGSTRTGEHVDALSESLRPWLDRWAADIALPLERTVGDEVQIVLTSADAALDLALTLARAQQWSVGIGVGPVVRAARRECAGERGARVCRRAPRR